uniref:Tyrosine-protein kinase n=1 Tax=Latimeria chalumnae TaxID=7897 RepID=H3A744_LATCH
DNPIAFDYKLVSLYNYKARTLQDLELQKGDHLELLKQQGDWLYVKKSAATSGQEVKSEGFVPKKFVVQVGSTKAEPWYFGDLRKVDVKRYLLRDENKEGAFLVWKNVESVYYLSVREGDSARHYKILQSDNCFYLVERQKFNLLSELVQHYSARADGLCARLDQPCVKVRHDETTHIRVHLSETWNEQIQVLCYWHGTGQLHFVRVEGLRWEGHTRPRKKISKQMDVENASALRKEAEIMKDLNHERLLKLYAVCMQEEPFFIVTELMKNGSLHKYLTKIKKSITKKKKKMMDFAGQIAEGMAYLEKQRCVHRDLRTENILLTEMLGCKIADFGLARFIGSNNTNVTMGKKRISLRSAPSTPLYRKFAITLKTWKFNLKLNSLCVWFFFHLSDKDNTEYIQELLKGQPLSSPADCPDPLHRILLQCWRRMPEERPTFTQLQESLTDIIRSEQAEDTAVAIL